MNKIQGLLNWCKYHTDGYPNVSINNFTSSWKNGLAFNALVHRFKPELIDFHHLDPENEYYNNYVAFKLAETHFGIPSLLDPKDMALMVCPERLSIITYVSQFYNCLKEMEPNGGPEINKFENINNDNSELERISSRSSVHKLTKMKCSICQNKVYLLERYVAEDKLYHRHCYRDFQIKNIGNDSEVIGDYLNIYGELKPTMNKNIFIHPFQRINSDNGAIPVITNLPIKAAEEIISNSDISEDSESLSSFSSKDSELGDNNQLEPIIKEPLNKNSDLITNLKEIQNCCTNTQENLVLNIVKTTQLKPMKTRLYIKKRDRELPYSTFFEVSDNINYKTRMHFLDYDINEKPNDQTENYDILNVDENSVNINKPNDQLPVVHTKERKLLEIKTMDELESDLSSAEEEPLEMIQPSIVRDSIWRKPIICSTSVRKCHSASVPIETKYKCYSEFKDRLENLNSKQSLIESKGRNIQLRLWEEDPNTPEYDDLLVTWLNLVAEKDKLFYEENALYSWLQDVKLREMKENIEYQIRLLSASDEQNEYNKDIEKELIKKLIETVNKRSDLVDAMNEENIKRLEAIQMRQKALETLPLKDKKLEEITAAKRDKPCKKKTSFWRKKSSQT